MQCSQTYFLKNKKKIHIYVSDWSRLLFSKCTETKLLDIKKATEVAEFIYQMMCVTIVVLKYRLILMNVN